jgi:hypothetical protein
MPSILRGATVVTALLLAACGGDEPGETASGATAVVDTAAILPGASASSPAKAFDSAVAAVRADTAAAAPGAGAAAVPESRQPPARPAPPEPITPEEAQRHTLSMENIRKLARAGAELAQLQQRNPAMRDSMAVRSADPNAILERLSNVPEARAAVGRAGMSPREYTLTTIALMQAAIVSQARMQGQAPPIPAHEENVRLVTENFEEIQTLMRQVMQQ